MGTLTGSGPERQYRPDANRNGSDVVEYAVTDPAGLVATGRVQVTVVPVNDDPIGRSDRYQTVATDTLRVEAPGVLANDDDVDDARLRARVVGLPARGDLQFGADGGFVYEPDPAFVGEVRFAYEAVDGAGAAQAATVVIDVIPPAAVSSPERVTAVDAITGFTADPVTESGATRRGSSPIERSAPSVERTLVLMSRASGVAVQQMGFPFIVMVVTALAVLLLGRLRIVPLLAWRSRAVGTVQQFSADHGFGLVIPDRNGGEVFVHRSSVRRRDRHRLRPGDRVRYRVVSGEHRDLATRLRRM
jgi:cold shock CspA family protein